MPVSRASLLSLSLLAFGEAFSTHRHHNCATMMSNQYHRTATMSTSRQGLLSMQSNDNDVAEPQRQSSDRRGFIGNLASSIAVVAGGMAAVSSPNPALARDELYKPNPLTNSVLEQIRIWEQEEKDNIKYGGELAAGDSGNKGKVDAYPSLLVPILKIQYELEEVQNLVHDKENSKQSWKKALTILSKDQYQKINFKKTFNAYGDNIYYSDPDRANAYLGGGATPKNEQSIAYLLRNDVLTNIENLQAELEYLLKEDDDVEDLYQYSDIAVGAMKKYMAIVPPNELEQARQILSKSG